jgi:lipid-binding SYLF domain-containing protein
MKYAVKMLLMFALFVSTVPAFADKDDAEKAARRLDRAVADLDKLTNAGDAGIPQSILDDANCIAIVPKLIKGGFIFGAEHGRGVATCRNGRKWSAPAFFTMTGGNWGAQIGVEGIQLVMLFMNEDGARKLLSANWKIGADVGIAAGPYGRAASANTDWKMNTGILTYSRAKGAYIGVDLAGSNVRADSDAIRAFYGREYDFRDLLEGRVAPPQAAEPFLAGIQRNFHEAEASK